MKEYWVCSRTQSDAFNYKVLMKDRSFTRRGIFSIVQFVYDPLGIIVPLLLDAKHFLQELCERNYGWGCFETVTETLAKVAFGPL